MATQGSGNTPKHAVYAKGKMGNFYFTPRKITIKRGQTVTWINTTGMQETATSMNHFNVNLPPHKRGSCAFKKAGVFKYNSVFFPNLTGKVIVRRH